MILKLLRQGSSYPKLLVLRSILESQGIRCFLEEQPYSLMPSLFQKNPDQYSLFVEARDWEDAQTILGEA
jgi:hypothetical protein